jgi:hypothetical protein
MPPLTVLSAGPGSPPVTAQHPHVPAKAAGSVEGEPGEIAVLHDRVRNRDRADSSLRPGSGLLRLLVSHADGAGGRQVSEDAVVAVTQLQELRGGRLPPAAGNQLAELGKEIVHGR